MVGITGILFIMKIKKPKMNYKVTKQSEMHNILKTFFSRDIQQNKTFSQLAKRSEDGNTKVVIIDNSAYWVKNNIFYVSSLINGRPNPNEAVPVDIYNMPKNELDKMLFILDNLGGGKNERGNSRNE
jgi:hypothetical protein